MGVYGIVVSGFFSCGISVILILTCGIAKPFTLLKMCVTSLLCGPRADLWPFYGF